jgi:hypothetical protein
MAGLILAFYLVGFAGTFFWYGRRTWKFTVKDADSFDCAEEAKFKSALKNFEDHLPALSFIAFLWPVFIAQSLLAKVWNRFFHFLWSKRRRA